MPNTKYRQSISGEWNFRLDPDNEGLDKQWFRRPELFQSKIRVPGAFQAQGFGDNRYCTPLCQAKGIPPMVMEKNPISAQLGIKGQSQFPRLGAVKTSV